MSEKIFFILVAIGLPISIVGSVMHWPPTIMFGVYCITIIALAAYMGRATESLAIVAGPTIGGLLNATFGNAVELIISIFALKQGLVGVVLASLTGSVIGNLLLVGGLTFFVGGLKYKRQQFNVHNARHNAGLLIFAIVLAFVIPEVFSMELGESETFTLSIGVAVVLIVLYLCALFFKLVTHHGVYKSKEDDVHEEEEPEWGKRKAITVLAIATLAVAYVSENLVHTFESVAEAFGWSELFIGIIIVAIVGNAAEHATAILMAYKNKMNVAVEIAIGSTLQIAMFVVPVLVLASMFFETKMPLVFTLPELIAMITAVFLTISITNDGDSNWFEGLTLIAAYVIMGLGFYLL